ncbi:MAG: FliM/FliN family flagellar motor switch protein [Bryobacteraceae bacterium]
MTEKIKSPAPVSSPLDVLMETELPVRVVVGRTRLPLQEVRQLAPGSVIELDGSILDTVDLIADDRLIARGEIVAVDGSYGFRVGELVIASTHKSRSARPAGRT